MPEKVIIGLQLQITEDRLKVILDSAKDYGATDNERVGRAALGLLESYADGGFMLEPAIVQRLEETSGQELSDALLVERFEAGCGRDGDSQVFTFKIDPLSIPPLQQIADANGLPSVASFMEQCIKDLFDAGHFSGSIPNASRVLMSPEDHAELVTLLDANFDNGTELASLIKAKIGKQDDMFEGVS